MSSREDILQSIRRATHVKYEKPDLKPLEDMALTYCVFWVSVRTANAL